MSELSQWILAAWLAVAISLFLLRPKKDLYHPAKDAALAILWPLVLAFVGIVELMRFLVDKADGKYPRK